MTHPVDSPSAAPHSSRWGIASIRLRLILAMTVLLALLFGVAALAYQGFRDLSGQARELVDRQARFAFLATRANQQTQSSAHQLLRLLLEDRREARVQLYAAMDDALNVSDMAIAQLETAAISGALGQNVAEVRRCRERYGELFQETVEQVELHGPEGARRHFEEHTEPALKKLLAAAERLATEQQDAMETTVRQLTAAAAAAQRQVVAIALGALLIGGLLAGLVARSIVRPVNAAAEFADSIASGDYTREPPPGGRDEIGRMLGAMGAMRQRIAQREAHISRIAYRDQLTDLPNRARFFESFGQGAAQGQGALLLFNLDRFRPINKALGHEVGDELLRAVAARLQAALPPDALLARLAGDEFAVYWPDLDDATASARATELLAVLRAPTTIVGQHLDVDASCGIALYPKDGADASALMHRADAALRAAKRLHAGYALACAHAEAPAPEQLSLIGEMREALARDQFLPYYQPKLDLRSGRIVAAEALIRWRHPARGLVPPGAFIPFAEQTGFIREITPWLIDRVAADLARWRRDGLDLQVSVNLSTHDLLDGGLVARVLAALAREALPPAALCLEITESALMEEPERALNHLEQLAAHGLHLAIDDYGSGQASLAYVKNLPVHELKIDRIFVSDVDTTPKNAAIVRSTALLCRELGLTVVAEGAERAGEIAWLAANGCDLVQGFGVARPLPEADFLAAIAARHGAAA